jgi:hypothetical protein
MCHSKWKTVSFVVLTCVIAVIKLSNSCRADAMNSWQGASAIVDANGKQATDAGATAAASTYGSYTASSAGGWGQPLTIGISGSGSANASGNPDNLLTAGAYLTLGATGRLTAPLSPTYPISATASWNNDAVIVNAPPGASLPNSVQLQFKVDLLPDSSVQASGLSTAMVKANGQTFYLDGGGYSGGIQLQPPLPWPGTNAGVDQDHTGTFDIKLALHPNGVSDPFSLSVSVSRATEWSTMYSVFDSGDKLSLSLTGVTLPDGTPLTAAGYGVSFASGLTLPEQPVPEPATFVLWGLLAAGALTFRHRAVSSRAGR